MFTVPLSMRKYWLHEMPSPTAESTFILAFFTEIYSPAFMACLVFPVT